jgi:hypothetical protein
VRSTPQASCFQWRLEHPVGRVVHLLDRRVVHLLDRRVVHLLDRGEDLRSRQKETPRWYLIEPQLRDRVGITRDQFGSRTGGVVDRCTASLTRRGSIRRAPALLYTTRVSGKRQVMPWNHKRLARPITHCVNVKSAMQLTGPMAQNA